MIGSSMKKNQYDGKYEIKVLPDWWPREAKKRDGAFVLLAAIISLGFQCKEYRRMNDVSFGGFQGTEKAAQPPLPHLRTWVLMLVQPNMGGNAATLELAAGRRNIVMDGRRSREADRPTWLSSDGELT